MKRKVKKGIKFLTQLIEGQALDSKDSVPDKNSRDFHHGIGNLNKTVISDHNDESPKLKDHILYLIYVYRSYGYIVTQQLDVLITINT